MTSPTGRLKVAPAVLGGIAADWTGADLDGNSPPDGPADWPSQQAARNHAHATTAFSHGLKREFDEFGNSVASSGRQFDSMDQQNSGELAKGVDMSGMAAMINAFTGPAGQIAGQVVNLLGQSFQGVTQIAGQGFGQGINMLGQLAKNSPGAAAPAMTGTVGGAGSGGSVAGSAPVSPAAGLGPPPSGSQPGREQREPGTSATEVTETSAHTAPGGTAMPLGLGAGQGTAGTSTTKPRTYHITTERTTDGNKPVST